MNTLILADSYPLLMETAVLHLAKLPQISVLATCQSERELKHLLVREEPDILILDLDLVSGNALKFCANLLSQHPKLKVLLFTTMSDIHLLRQFFQIGIRGYLPHTAQSHQLVKAVEALIDGQIYLPDFFKNQLAEITLGIHASDSDQLTNREKEVLKLIIDEHTTREIAQKLYISDSTAETHRLNLIHKLGVRNTAGLVREGVMKGLYL